MSFKSVGGLLMALDLMSNPLIHSLARRSSQMACLQITISKVSKAMPLCQGLAAVKTVVTQAIWTMTMILMPQTRVKIIDPAHWILNHLVPHRGILRIPKNFLQEVGFLKFKSRILETEAWIRGEKYVEQSGDMLLQEHEFFSFGNAISSILEVVLGEVFRN